MKHRGQILRLIVGQGIVGMTEYTDFADDTIANVGNLDSQLYELEELVKQTEYREKDRSREAYMMAGVILESIYTKGGAWVLGNSISRDALELETLIEQEDFATATSLLLEIMNHYAKWIILEDFAF